MKSLSVKLKIRGWEWAIYGLMSRAFITLWVRHLSLSGQGIYDLSLNGLGISGLMGWAFMT